LKPFSRKLHSQGISCPYHEPDQSNPHYSTLSILSISILSFPLRLGLLRCLFLPPITYMHSSSPIRATCPAHLIFFDLIIPIILGEKNKLRNSSLFSFLYSLITSSLFGQNILLSILFSNILSLCSSLSVRDQPQAKL
jgi:hypothetical protein